MLSAKCRKKFSFMEAAARPFVKIEPNLLTAAGIIVSVITLYALTIDFILGGILIFITGFFDMLDGMVARSAGKTSKKGSYIDAMSDRVTEFFILMGFGFATGLWMHIAIALFFSQMISYAKSRCGMEVKTDNIKWPEIFERGERVLYLGITAIILGFVAFWAEPILIIFILLSLISLTQRISRALKILK